MPGPKVKPPDIQTPYSRPWTPVQPIDILRWLGILFDMANHIEPNRQAYWQVLEYGTTHHPGRYMSRVRWEQIHRYLTFNISPARTRSQDNHVPMEMPKRRHCA